MKRILINLDADAHISHYKETYFVTLRIRYMITIVIYIFW